MEFECIASGTLSQASSIFAGFKGYNQTCVANSVVALAYYLKTPGTQMNASSIDSILYSGSAYYNLCLPEGDARHLSTDDLNYSVAVPNGKVVKIAQVQMVGNEDMGYMISEDFLKRSSYEERIHELVTRIQCGLADNNSGFLFIRNAKAISFWHSDGEFVLFDPHNVDDKRNVDSVLGKARLFRCSNLPSLARCILNDESYNLYDLSTIKFEIDLIETLSAGLGSLEVGKSIYETDVESVTSQLSDVSLKSPFTSPPLKMVKARVGDVTAPGQLSPYARISRPSSSEQEIPQGNVPVKRSRGRPRRLTDVGDEMETKPSEAPKQGRGRPKITGKPSVQTALVTADVVHESTPVRRRPGRPSKKSKSPPSPSDDDKISSLDSTPKQRAPGRPKRIVPDSDRKPSSEGDSGEPEATASSKRIKKGQSKVSDWLESGSFSQSDSEGVFLKPKAPPRRPSEQQQRDSSKSSSTTSSRTCDLSTSEDEVVGEASKKKNRRGRPPKKKATSSTVRSVVGPSKKRRGRPRKDRSSSSTSQLEAVRQSTTVELETDGDSRIASCSESDASVVSTSTESSSLSTDSKKRRGRPRKGTTLEQQNKAARDKYKVTHPDKVKVSKDTYDFSHPDVVRGKKKRYVDSHPDRVKNYQDSYHKTELPFLELPEDLRSVPSLGNLRGPDLDKVSLYTLKEPTSLIDPLTPRCGHCDAPRFHEESATRCCKSGQLAALIPRLPEANPPFFRDAVFLHRARAYNHLFAFSAINHPSDHGFVPSTTPAQLEFLKLHGRIYHTVYSLENSNPRNSSRFYIHDPIERLDRATGLSLDSDIVAQIDAYLEGVSPILRDLRRLSTVEGDNAYMVFRKTSRVVDGGGPDLDQIPCDEVAGLVNPGEDIRSVKVWKTGSQKSEFVNILEETYEPFQYPLIFPHGTPGWHLGMTTQGIKVSQIMYYRYRLLSEVRFTQLRRLSQEYVIDMYCRAEEERLMYIRNNQSDLRIAPRSDLTRVVDHDDDETIEGEGGAREGRVYLPKSFTQSERYYRVNYFDAMAIVMRKGKPTYFITFICNPHWPEVENSLLPGQRGMDRPDLNVRVFNEKLKHFERCLMSGKIFGELEYLIRVIEFQKRGLPHAHIVIRVKEPPAGSCEIDKFVRATIPSESEAGGRLRAAVLKHMVHGPCGTQSPNSPCMDERTKKCTKRFPKKPSDVTHQGAKGFFDYRRPCDVQVELPSRGSRPRRTVDDSWVVSYNPTLLLMFDAHVNVDISSGASVIKYLMKYVHRGPDRSSVAVVSQDKTDDEIVNYLNMRYVSASEALWRTFEYDIIRRRPTVVALPVHLPDQDHIVYRPGNEQDLLARRYSKLMLYLDRPQTAELETLTYVAFYENYFVELKNNTRIPKSCDPIPHPNGLHVIWKRQRNECVCRINWMSPTTGEVFYLRLLISNSPAYSYESLRTVNGTVFETFQEAATHRGLLQKDDEYAVAMREAIIASASPRQLRQLFFIMVLYGDPAKLLWDEFRDELSDDFLKHDDDDDKRAAHLRALSSIGAMLRRHGRTLAEMGLEEVADAQTELGRELLSYNTTELADSVSEREKQLNSEQKVFFEDVLKSIFDPLPNEKKCFFLDGPAGTGKTFLLNTLCSKLRSMERVVLPVATTGIAALNYVNGTTAHSMFRIPLDADENSISGVKFTSQRGDLIRSASLIVYDECSMVSCRLVRVVDRLLQDLMKNTLLFGGKTIVFSGDFRQIPPIVRDGGNLDSYEVCLKRAHFWPETRGYKLETIVRSKDDERLSRFVLGVGEGKVATLPIDKVDVIPLHGIPTVDSLDELIRFVFPADVLAKPEECSKRALLALTNDEIDKVNEKILGSIEGEEFSLFSADKVVDDDETALETDAVTTETLHLNHEPGVPGHVIRLKKNCVCMIVRNLSFQNSLVNGTKIIIERISPYLLHARTVGTGEVVLIPRIKFNFQIGSSGIQMTRQQFPVRLAYAMTVNKSQGQTLDIVGIDLRSDCFSHGQLYVALGRVRSTENVVVLVDEERTINGVAHTKNIVFSPFLS